MLIETKKLTRASFKSYIKKHRDSLFILNESDFDGMTDCVQQLHQAPRKASFKDYTEQDLGINGIWLVGSSRDYFTAFEDEVFKGIEVSNCCGCFKVGIIK